MPMRQVTICLSDNATKALKQQAEYASSSEEAYIETLIEADARAWKNSPFKNHYERGGRFRDLKL